LNFLSFEKLNFSDKKCSLREIGNAQYARMLSSFAYNTVISTIKSKSFRSGVHVKEINPAYTSIIGRIKFAKRYRFSVHESAALCIGRRCLGASERLPRHHSQVPDGKGGHVTLSLPVRNRDKHVWSSWRLAQKRLLKRCLQHTFGRMKRSSSRSFFACCDTKILKVVGEIPTRESTTKLLGSRV
jgi:IS605 OrfB family transposase